MHFLSEFLFASLETQTLTIFIFLDEDKAMETYKISSLISEDLVQDGWSNQLIFFAFPQEIKDIKKIKYYVDSAEKPYRHRVLTDYDDRESNKNDWNEELTFWALTESNTQMQAYTVLYRGNPYQSQIVEGSNIHIPEWEVHSVFWAYSKPGKCCPH